MESFSLDTSMKYLCGIFREMFQRTRKSVSIIRIFVSQTMELFSTQEETRWWNTPNRKDVSFHWLLKKDFQNDCITYHASVSTYDTIQQALRLQTKPFHQHGIIKSFSLKKRWSFSCGCQIQTVGDFRKIFRVWSQTVRFAERFPPMQNFERRYKLSFERYQIRWPFFRYSPTHWLPSKREMGNFRIGIIDQNSL